MSNRYKAGMILLGAFILVLLLYAMKFLIWVAVTVLFYMLVNPLACIRPFGGIYISLKIT